VSTVSEVATPFGASVYAQVTKMVWPAGPVPIPIDASKSSLVPLWKPNAVVTVLLLTFTAPYRMVGKPARSTSWANQIDVLRWSGGTAGSPYRCRYAAPRVGVPAGIVDPERSPRPRS
jgi:hypothetical protein